MQNLIKDDKLKTAGGKGPRLYLTEFGYFNRPLKKLSKTGWYSEGQRAGWLRAALQRAREVSPRPGMFTFYKLAEAWPDKVGLDPGTPDNPKNPTPITEAKLLSEAPVGFDTGMAHPASLAVAGVRPYGVGDVGQTRQAFCAIRADALEQPGYSVSSDNTGLPDQCSP